MSISNLDIECQDILHLQFSVLEPATTGNAKTTTAVI